jgi:hypothetical protein
MIVLDELDTRLDMFGELTPVEAFVEEATRIAEHLRLDDLDFRQRRSSYLDGHATWSVRRFCRYLPYAFFASGLASAESCSPSIHCCR